MGSRVNVLRLVAERLAGVDIRDLYLVAGLALLALGLHLLAPWLGFAVVGALLFAMSGVLGVIRRSL